MSSRAGTRRVSHLVQRKLALDGVAHRDTGFSELSYQLGYSHVAAFHRVFRRWTGQTPRYYRRMRQMGAR